MILGLFGKKEKQEITLDEVTSLLGDLRLPTSLVFTPTNLEEEKKKFFDSDTYNPLFQYRIVNNDNDRILSDLRSVYKIIDVDPRISEFYIQLIDAKAEMNELMKSVGDNVRFTHISTKRFKKPSPILFRNACRILRNSVKPYSLAIEPKNERILNYDEIKEVIEKVYQAYGLEDWTVAESMNIQAGGMKVGVKRKEILMDKNITRTLSKLKKSVVHEMVHIIRSHNGHRTGFEALSKPNLPRYLDVEEGLASYTEEIMGVMRYRDLKKGASKIWALYIGEELTFRELYNAALAFSKRKEAFELAFRVKRGLGDTSMPGLYRKDVSYFRGFRRVRKKCAADKTLYKKLFAGKISLNQVRWVDEGLIPKPEIVPSAKKYKEIFEAVL